MVDYLGDTVAPMRMDMMIYHRRTKKFVAQIFG